MNYQHLFYFKTVATSGGITAAAKRLRLTPPTLSAQIRTFEESLGVSLFERSARGMLLTEEGWFVLRYADRIFALGNELEQGLRGERDAVRRVGIETSMVAGTVRPLLARLAGSDDRRVVCTFDSHDGVLTGLRSGALDLGLTTAPLVDSSTGELESRLVFEAEVAFFANRETADKLRGRFPSSLDGCSFIAPPRSLLREQVERWLARTGVKLAANVEIGDASVAAALSGDGIGLLLAPLRARVELEKRYELHLVGKVPGIRARIYAIGTPEILTQHLALLTDEATSADALHEPEPPNADRDRSRPASGW